MFGFARKRKNDDPRQKMYADLMKKAMERQRAGDIVGCSELHSEAERLLAEMEKRTPAS